MILRITSGKPRSALMWRAHRDGTLGGRVVEPDAFAESQNSEAGKGNSR